MMRRISFALALAAGYLALGAGQAPASQVSCGDTITTDTTLHHDLVDCPNNGILIGADNVTLDLNGHTIDGNGTPDTSCNPVTDFCDFGVAFEHHDGITVKHGSIRQFEGGLGAFSTRHTHLLGLATSRNHFSGIGLAADARILVRNCSGNGSTFRGGDGLGLFDSHHVRIVHSSFRQNGEVGIHVVDSTHNLIRGNPTSRNGAFGIILEESDRNQVRDNRSVHDGVIGIYLAPGSRNVIAGNRVSHPTSTRGGEGTGIEIDGGDHNVIGRNSIRDIGGHGIAVGFDVVVGNVVRRNHIRGAGEDGVHVDAAAERTLLKRNHAVGAKDDGFDVDSPATTLTQNHAVHNGDLGIEAVFGVTDGGGNKASGNGNPAQCLNVVCK
jgi:parallel beta-helix repeat protein